MLLVNLTTIVRLGNIFLIVCHFLLGIIEVDSKSDLRNQVSSFKPQRGNMEDDVTPRLFVIKNKPSTKRFSKKLPRKRRNFINKVKMCYNLPINTGSATCTPFFIRRSHRKTIRLKDPMLEWNTVQADNSAANELLLQKQNGGKLKKFFFNKPTSTPSSAEMDSLEFTNGKNKNKHKTTIPLNLLEPSSEKNHFIKSSAIGLSTNVYNVAASENTLAHGLPLSTVFVTDHPTSKTSVNNTGAGKTRSHQIHGSSAGQPAVINKTTNPSNVSTPKTKSILKRLNIKKFFHFSKGNTSTESHETKNVHSGNILQHLRTLDVTYSMSNKTTDNDTRNQFSTQNKKSNPYLPTSSILNKFRIHHKQKYFSTEVFTWKFKDPNSVGPVLEQTTEILETQIPPSLNQHTVKEGYKSESYFSSTAGFYNMSTENVTKNKHFWNMLHLLRKTTSDKVDQLKDSTFDSKNIVSHLPESRITSPMTENESNKKTDSWQGNENLNTYRFNLKNRKFIGGNHPTLKASDPGGKEVSEKSSTGATIGSTIKSVDDSNKKLEYSETTIHNPFKIKYLMKFKGPMASTQSNNNKSSTIDLTTDDTCIDEEVLLSTETTTKTINTQNSLNRDIVASSQLVHDSTQHTLKANQYPLTICGQNENSTEQLTSHDQNRFSTSCSKNPIKFKDIIGFKKHKAHGKNKNRKHNNSNHGLRESHKLVCCNKTSTDNMRGKFNVTVHKAKSRRFRDWFFGETTIPVKRKGHKNEEECTFRWCFRPTINNSRSTSPPQLLNHSSETPRANTSEKKLKHFFRFRTSSNPLYEYNSTTESVSGIATELTNHSNTKPTRPYGRTKKYNVKGLTLIGKLHSHSSSSSTSFNSGPSVLTSMKNPTNNEHRLEVTSLQSDITSSGTFQPNVSIKVYGRGKVQQFFHRFHTGKMHSGVSTFNPKGKEIKSLQNSSILLNPDYADYIETKVEKKKLKKHSNRTVIHNASDVNDTSVNIMAYVMKPFDSLVSVFKALSPNSVTKIGDVNATDIKNGSLPHHLQPPNSSIVILAVNNTNATSRDVHESKLGLALDLLGGMYHCVFNSFVEAKPEDVHFYLYTRNNPEDPEELLLPESRNGNVTNTTDVPQPVLEKEKLDLLLGKREIGDYDYDQEDFEFETLNPAKSEIKSKWFNIHAETKVLIHGYLQDYQTDIMVSMREAYLSQGPHNVVLVDWSVLVGDSSCYPVVASRGLRQVGSLLAQLLNKLIEGGVSSRSIHIVGFSLGAHVAGHAGTLLSLGLVSRITGLDPALPYVPMEPDMSLDSDDAVFVDIIHSAAGLLGQSGPMGHVDFYPNGGSQQPGCEVSSLSCSHRRAALYFIESINSDAGFQATKCDSWHHFQADNCTVPAKTLMGEPCPADARGKFYLITGYRSPFSIQPEEHVKVKKSLLLDLFYDSEDL